MGKPKHFGFARKTMACVMAASMLTLVTVPASVAIADNGAADTETQAMYRLYNPNSGEHFYTASDVEKDATVAAGWNYEGIGWHAPVTSETPVYRVYSGTDHHYTKDAGERDALVQLGWKDEGTSFYSDDQERVPLYRQFNPNVDPNAATNNAGSHNYTTSLDEHSRLVSIGWNDEGIGWYGVSGAEAPVVPVDPFNTGVVDPSKAAIGEDTPGLVSLEDANSYNVIELDKAVDENKDVTVSQEIIPYLHTTEYGAPVDLKIELLTPSNAKNGTEGTPLLVWINGGGFTSSNAANNFETRLALAKSGYTVASVQHRVGPSVTFPGPLQDIKAAIRFLKAGSKSEPNKYKFNPNKVAVAGNSSGGYWATMVGVTSNLKSIQYPDSRSGDMREIKLDEWGSNRDESSAVNAVIDFYGVSDLTIIGSGLAQELQDSHKSAATTEALLLNGASAGAAKPGVFDDSMVAKVSAASPFSYIDANTVPFLMFHGTADTLVSPVATKMLQNRLNDAGVHTERYVVEGAGHGGKQFEQGATIERAVKFLNTYANTPISTVEPTVNLAKGSKAYAAEDLPTLAQATEGAEQVAVDPNHWTLGETTEIGYKTISEKGVYKNLRMTILTPSKGRDDAPRPVLYIAACGGFSSSNADAMRYLRYAERGYVVAVAEIRVIPATTNPGPLQDAKAGIRWLRAHADTYNIDPNCFIATGTSAGGYMASMLGVLGNTTKFDDNIQFDVGDNLEYSSAVQGVVDMYGVSDLTLIGAGTGLIGDHQSEANTEALLINGTAFGQNPGGSVFSNLDKTAKFSPFTYLDAEDPSILSFHGVKDTLVSPISTMELYKRSKELGADSERYAIHSTEVNAKGQTVEGASHGGWQFSTKKVNDIIDAYMDGIVAANK